MSRPLRSALAATLLASLLGVPAAAQEAPGEAQWRAELQAITAEIAVTADRQRELEAEIAALDRDRAGLNRELVETNQRVQALETQIGEAEARMAGLLADEDVLRRSLAARRDVLAEVLAVLQRMGRTPPPAIVVQPGDALAAVRSAILLGAVVPELRGEADALIADIESLVALREEQAAERDRLIATATDLADESERLELLVAERQRSLNQTQETLAAEQGRAGTLANQAQTLGELIAAVAAANRPPAAAGAELAFVPIEPGVPNFLDPADRIAPSVAFRTLRGRLPRTASGDLVTAYGASDGFGGIAQGLTIATRPGARVSAPSDGWIEFAGPYRSYGNLLIIDAGDGYRIVLSGMQRIDVQNGQFVLAGEPVAAMEAVQVAGAAGADMGAARPLLYVEFRKDGESIDPGPWWADPY
ncbi:MAG: peptidoglycan DD-metalloendopeptidase family protein [Bauldia sp.]|nr:peptidoglycan DD-metalloendopeptidase family protein [Bauldia sp.]MCW5718312.1 peptidoglycan DD-metalloendopeptidase family protein [Bauldia sp.]